MVLAIPNSQKKTEEDIICVTPRKTGNELGNEFCPKFNSHICGEHKRVLYLRCVSNDTIEAIEM